MHNRAFGKVCVETSLYSLAAKQPCVNNRSCSYLEGKVSKTVQRRVSETVCLSCKLQSKRVKDKQFYVEDYEVELDIVSAL